METYGHCANGAWVAAQRPGILEKGSEHGEECGLSLLCFYLLLSTEGVDLRGPPGPPGPRGPPGKNSLIFGSW